MFEMIGNAACAAIKVSNELRKLKENEDGTARFTLDTITKAVEGLSAEGVTNEDIERLIDDPLFCQMVAKLLSRSGTEIVMQKLLGYRRYSDDELKTHPAYDYAKEPCLPIWEEQLDRLRQIEGFEKLNPDGLNDQFEYWSNQPIWDEKFTYAYWKWTGSDPIRNQRVYKRELPLWDGYLVSALPGKASRRLGFGDLWEDVEKGPEAEGKWGRLFKEVIFPEIEKAIGRFDTTGDFYLDRWLRDNLCSCQCRPSLSNRLWYKEIEQEAKGDFILRPINFGSRLASRSISTGSWIAENLFQGIAAPGWLAGQALVICPNRITERPGLCFSDELRSKSRKIFSTGMQFEYYNVKQGIKHLDIVGLDNGFQDYGVLTIHQ